MFGAAKTAGLPLGKDDAARAAMLAGINMLLGLRLESRTQMTVPEMQLVAVAIDAGAFSGNWKLAPGFAARVRVTITPEISEVAAHALAPDAEEPDYAGYDDAFYTL